MEFRIADTFLASLAKLTNQEQKLVKTTVFDLQVNPAHPGMQLHKLDKARDPHFWSIRVNRDVRLIVHRSPAGLLACYVNHHDKAYQWAEQRKLERHPATGAAQIVQIRETVKEITIPCYVEAQQPAPAKPPLFAECSDERLLGYGVPADWLPDVRGATEDTILDLAEFLPAEAAEALLELATGGTPQAAQRIAADADAFAHPDAQRRFRVMKNAAELERALDYPWERWSIFLHPAQRHFVEQRVNGPARVSGSAGTGKTIVALHRAVFLARANPDARVLLTTFSTTLANALRVKLRRLIEHEPRLAERIDVYAMRAIGHRLYALNFGEPKIASREVIAQLLQEAARNNAGHVASENPTPALPEGEGVAPISFGEGPGVRFSDHFVLMEWEQTVDAWQLDTWEAYRDVRRLGRKTRLSERKRAILWSIFSRVRARLRAGGLLTRSDLFSRLAAHLVETSQPPFDFAVVDEAQDISVAQLRFLAALGGGRPNSLFFAGDLGQRIFQQPFSWKELGVDIRGRCRTLRINYRTSHQIRVQADRLLDSRLADVDGNAEDRSGTISVFNGPRPGIEICDTPDDEIALVTRWLTERLAEDAQPEEIGVFVRSPRELPRACAAVEGTGTPFNILDEHVETTSGRISVSTMHLAKGLEFRAVAVMACDDEALPLQERIDTIADESDLEDAYNTERHLLYVACTRARDNLLISGVDPASEFLDDLRF